MTAVEEALDVAEAATPDKLNEFFSRVVTLNYCLEACGHCNSPRAVYSAGARCQHRYLRADVVAAALSHLAAKLERAEAFLGRYLATLQRFANLPSLPLEDAVDLDGVAKEAQEALGKQTAAACPIHGVACADHGFVHGEEAEELRVGIERLAQEYRGEEGKRVTALCDALLGLLEEVDARDSLAFCSTRETQP